MATPTIQTIEGQGGNIQCYSQGFGNIIIQVRNWRINVRYINADVTVTCSGGWREMKRVLAEWEFSAEWPYDATASRIGAYQGVQLINNIYVPVGLAYPVPGACVFQIGAAGTPSVPGTLAVQYQGNALVSATNTDNPATDVVKFNVNGQGTGPLIGPIAAGPLST